MLLPIQNLLLYLEEDAHIDPIDLSSTKVKQMVCDFGDWYTFELEQREADPLGLIQTNFCFNSTLMLWEMSLICDGLESAAEIQHPEIAEPRFDLWLSAFSAVSKILDDLEYQASQVDVIPPNADEMVKDWLHYGSSLIEDMRDMRDLTNSLVKKGRDRFRNQMKCPAYL